MRGAWDFGEWDFDRYTVVQKIPVKIPMALGTMIVLSSLRIPYWVQMMQLRSRLINGSRESCRVELLVTILKPVLILDACIPKKKKGPAYRNPSSTIGETYIAIVSLFEDLDVV
jgi:hypothetical protein